jgi:hypothetical protein
VTATNAMLNPMCETRMVGKPRYRTSERKGPIPGILSSCTNIDSSDEPSTISGTAIARKMMKLIRPLPRKA